MLEEFETQISAIYQPEDDPIWEQAMAELEKLEEITQAKVQQRVKELGIAPECAPGVHIQWYGRGRNASASRRAELRKLAMSRIDAKLASVRTVIERMSLEAQTEVVGNGLESEAARTFLEKMPDVDTLMPPLEIEEVKRLMKYGES
jgi:hypothetical protein